MLRELAVVTLLLGCASTAAAQNPGYLFRGPMDRDAAYRVARRLGTVARPPPDPALRALAERLRASTVRVMPSGTERLGGAGFIATRSGLVVTAAHVVGHRGSRPRAVQVSLGDGPLVRAEVLVYLPGYDVAVLRPSAPLGGLPLPLGEDSELEVGDELMAYGHPGGRPEVATWGVVQAEARVDGSYVARPGDAQRWSFRDAIQTNQPLIPGNSGGPVATHEGQVVGLVGGSNDRGSVIIPARHIRAAIRIAEQEKGRPPGASASQRTSE